MLVLSRRKGERIWIGDTVEVTVLEISGSRVKLGFSGPPDAPIFRGEVRRFAQRADSEPRVGEQEDRASIPHQRRLGRAMRETARS